MDDINFDKKTADDWIRTIEDPSASIREIDIYPLIRDWLDDSSIQNILDIGCGQGVVSSRLGHPQIQYVGIDPSADLINRANELYRNPQRIFVRGNAYDIPFADKHFCSALSVAVWHLLSDISRASYELSRILKNGGKYLIITADPNKSKEWIDRYGTQRFEGMAFIGSVSNPDGTEVSDRLYFRNMEEIATHLKVAGLGISRIETVRSFVAIFGERE